MSETEYIAKHKFNLKRERDQIHPKKTFKVSGPLPPVINLSGKILQVYDQGSLGSCTANSLCGAFMNEDPTFSPSRIFLYYNERFLDNNVGSDDGSTLSQGVKALIKFGVSSETLCPYKIETFAEKPNDSAYKEALDHQVLTADHVDQTMNSMKSCLVLGFPIALGIEIYQSFESAKTTKTGLVPMPKKNEKFLGNHAVLCVGYDDTKQVWIMRNSWGATWGDHGNFYLPYKYLTDKKLATDMWKITKVETVVPKNKLGLLRRIIAAVKGK